MDKKGEFFDSEHESGEIKRIQGYFSQFRNEIHYDRYVRTKKGERIRRVSTGESYLVKKVDPAEMEGRIAHLKIIYEKFP